MMISITYITQQQGRQKSQPSYLHNTFLELLFPLDIGRSLLFVNSTTVELQWLENNIGTMKMYLRRGELELMGVNHSARSGGIIVGISFQFSLIKSMLCVLISIPSSRQF